MNECRKVNNMSNRYNISLAHPLLNGNEKKYVLDCLESTWISSVGKYVDEFEKKFAEFCGTKYAITCANGTVALHLALLACGIKPGDEVIVPTLTYIASANAVSYCGASPVFVDSEEKTWNIDPEKMEEKITDRTKAIMVVHLYGHPVNMEQVMKLAEKYNLYVIEDAAEAHGAEYKGEKVGAIGHIGCFSFFGNKIITTGEGGMITTNDNKLDEKIRLLRNQGMDPTKKYWFPVIGYNYRMTNLQAAVGLGQLENIQFHLKKRRTVATLYDHYLKPLGKFIETPKEQSWARHSFWMYSILLKNRAKVDRDQFMNLLRNDGIETRPIFYPMHTLPPYQETEGRFPIAENIARRGVNLPTHALLTEEEIQYIAERILYHCKG